MSNYWMIVNKVIRESDILLLVLDARLIEQTRNKDIERMVSDSRKKLIYVINKSDLINKRVLEKEIKLKNFVFISAKKRLGTGKLRDKIHALAAIFDKQKVIIGVLGYPNTGKSTVINTMTGRGSASTSPESGHTKGKQLLRMTSRIYFMDTPGVIPSSEKSEFKHALVASKNASKLKDPELVAHKLFGMFQEDIEISYDIKFDKDDDTEKKLEKLAIKFKRLLKGGLPDTERMARIIVKDWQRGKI
jgi:ribosome biogenesis GTPase A